MLVFNNNIGVNVDCVWHLWLDPTPGIILKSLTPTGTPDLKAQCLLFKKHPGEVLQYNVHVITFTCDNSCQITMTILTACMLLVSEFIIRFNFVSEW